MFKAGAVEGGGAAGLSISSGGILRFWEDSQRVRFYLFVLFFTYLYSFSPIGTLLYLFVLFCTYLYSFVPICYLLYLFVIFCTYLYSFVPICTLLYLFVIFCTYFCFIEPYNTCIPPPPGWNPGSAPGKCRYILNTEMPT